jgi:hypothetical protein
MTFHDLVPILHLSAAEADMCLLMCSHSTVSDRFLPCVVQLTLQDELLFDVTSAGGEEVVSRMTLHLSSLLRVSRRLPDPYGEELDGNPLSGFRITLHSSERIVVLYATTREVHREWITWLDDRIVSAKEPEPRQWRSSSVESATSVPSSVRAIAEPRPQGTDFSEKSFLVHRQLELYETSRPYPGHLLWCSNPELRKAFPEMTLAQHEVIRRMKRVEGPGTWSEIGQADPFVLDDRDNAAFNGREPWVRDRFPPSEYLSNVQGIRSVREELRIGMSAAAPPKSFSQHVAKWVTEMPWVDFVSPEQREKLDARNEAKRLLLRRISSLRVAMPDGAIRADQVPYDDEDMTAIEDQVAELLIPLPADIGPLEVPLFWEQHYDETKAGIIRMRETFAKRLRRR